MSRPMTVLAFPKNCMRPLVRVSSATDVPSEFPCNGASSLERTAFRLLQMCNRLTHSSGRNVAKTADVLGIGLFPSPHHQMSASADPGTTIPHLKPERTSQELTLTGTVRIIGVCGCRSRLSLTGTRPRDKGSSPGASVSASGRAREGFPFHAYVCGKREERR